MRTAFAAQNRETRVVSVNFSSPGFFKSYLLYFQNPQYQKTPLHKPQ